MATMKAIVREKGGVRLADVESPRRAGEVRVALRAAGICRTDLYVADGLLRVDEPRTLGHEASGVVIDGDDRFEAGARVVINPVLSCLVTGKEHCAACAAEKPCAGPMMLGVDRDGAFAEVVCVPTQALARAPDGVRWEVAAMAEPVAAALGVLRAPIKKGSRGAVYGTGRVADLMVCVLAEAGFAPLPWNDDLRDLAWVVEATVAGNALDIAMRALQPGGTLVLKSRPAVAASFDVALAVRRELVLVGRSYGKFAEAVAWLDRLELDALVGEVFPLERFEDAFTAARKDERRKVFFAGTS
jgi:L-iditol 2-dehydrogenase